MPVIAKINYIAGVDKLRYISQAAPIPDGWMVINDLSDADIRPLAEDSFANKIDEHAGHLATALAGMTMNRKIYDFYEAVMQSTANFSPSNLVEPLVSIKGVVDHAKTLRAARSSMTIDEMDAYDVSTDPGWP
jgi:hypothetical protein